VKPANAARLAQLIQEAAELVVEEIGEIVVQRMKENAPQAAPERRSKVNGKAGYTIKEAAAKLGVADKTVRRLIKRKLLGSSKALSKIYIPAKDVETFFRRTV
jgi:excisionase family DNA binding protein